MTPAVPHTVVPRAVWIGVGVALALALVATAAVWLARAREASKDVALMAGTPRSHDDIQALAKPSGLALQVLTLSDGTRLNSIVRPPANGGRSWLMYWGGNTSEYFREALVVLDGLNLPAVIGLACIAPRSFDGSQGVPTPAALRADAREVRLLWLRQHQATAQDLVLAGFSLGAYSVLAAAEGGAAGMVLLASFTRFDGTHAVRLARFRSFTSYFHTDNPASPVAALVLHGEDDDGFPLAAGREVAAWLGAPFLTYPGVGHADLQRHAPAHQAVREFVIRQLGGRPPSAP